MGRKSSSYISTRACARARGVSGSACGGHRTHVVFGVGTVVVVLRVVVFNGNDDRGGVGTMGIDAVVVADPFSRVAQATTCKENCGKRKKCNVSHAQRGLPLLEI
jgi:hypothetical protein